VDSECALYLFQISFRSKELTLARLILLVIQESGHNWNFQKEQGITGQSQGINSTLENFKCFVHTLCSE